MFLGKMEKFIALFRGINVGGRNRLPMKELVRVLEDLGYYDVRTYIQSGNVVMGADEELGEHDAHAIADSIEREFGFWPAIMLLRQADLEAAVAGNPFPTDVGKHLHFTFLEQQPEEPDLKTLQGLMSETEQMELGQRVFYFYAPDGIGRSKAAEKIERCLGVNGTARNFNTVSKLLEML